MNAHSTAILVGFMFCSGAILIAMSLIASTTHDASETQSAVQFRGYRLRKGWLWVLGAVAALAFAISLAGFPYGRSTQADGPHFKVFAFQYGFEMPATVPLNKTVVFDVTSRDVNHGFGIYDDADHLFAQVQSMPGYVNHLAVRFTRRGHYTVRCLEYCGIAHAAMKEGFEVR